LEDKVRPKQKSHSGSKKRFWLTGSGKVNRSHGGKNHKAETKNRKRKRNLRQITLVSSTQENTVKKMIPYKD
jgi:large subunit ribosomal protein L35